MSLSLKDADLQARMFDLERSRALVVDADQAMDQAIVIHRRRLKAGDKLGSERAINAAFRVWAQASIDYQQKQIELLAHGLAEAEERIKAINAKVAEALKQ